MFHINKPVLSKVPTFLTIAHISYRIYIVCVYIYILEQPVCEYAVISRQLALVINHKYLKQQFVQEQICRSVHLSNCLTVCLGNEIIDWYTTMPDHSHRPLVPPSIDTFTVSASVVGCASMRHCAKQGRSCSNDFQITIRTIRIGNDCAAFQCQLRFTGAWQVQLEGKEEGGERCVWWRCGSPQFE